MTKFQIITIAIFIVAIVAGVIAFATYKGGSSSQSLPTVTIWGTFPAEAFDQYVSKVNSNLAQGISVKYVQKNPENFSTDFVAALARNSGPDGILIPADMILPHEDKLALIPYSALPQRDFLDAYIQEAKIYLSSNGILAIPFTVDPLVMYWNRDMYNAAGLATYPKNWEDFTLLNKQITQKDQNGNIRKSAIAMGTFSNITNAREVLGSLLLQSNNPITTITAEGLPASTLKAAYRVSPAPSLQFFSQFADPANTNYSWNRAMPIDKSAFLSGMLATYFGMASELNDLRSKNPNLNFDVAPLPQVKSGGKVTAYARMYGFSITRASTNPNAVYQVIAILTTPANLANLSKTMYLPTVLNSLDQSSDDPYITNFNRAVLTASNWLDVDPVKSRQILGAMVESFTSGQKTASQAIQDAGDQYDLLLRQAIQ